MPYRYRGVNRYGVAISGVSRVGESAADCAWRWFTRRARWLAIIDQDGNEKGGICVNEGQRVWWGLGVVDDTRAIRVDEARRIAADLREEFPQSDIPGYIEREFGGAA